MNDAKFLLKNKGNESTSIRMEFRFYGIRFVHGTGIKINTKEWNGNKQRVRSSPSFPDYYIINRKLDRLNSLAKFTLRYFEDKDLKPTLNQFKKKFLALKGGEVNKNRQSIVEYLDNKIDEKRSKQVTKSSIDHLTRLRTKLKEFSKSSNYLFEDFDRELFDDFKDYLFELRLGQNYIRDLLKRFKTIFKNSFNEGLHKNNSYELIPLPEYKPVDNVVLSMEELKKIYKYDFSTNEKFEKVRDLFIIQCDSGLRFGDLKSITTDSIIEKDEKVIIKVFTSKTNTEVFYPISKRSLKIIEKYGGFPPVISAQKTNQYLKEICQIVGINEKFEKRMYKGGIRTLKFFEKWELVSTHTARRSFATNLVLMGVPASKVMLITGHRSEKVFQAYVKIESESNAMELFHHKYFHQ